MSENKTWKELCDEFGEQEIAQFTKMIYTFLSVFYEKMPLEGVAYFDETIFDLCMIDILYDLKRMKDFHEVKDISYERLLAYAAGWIIKRKPFQMIKGYEKSMKNNRFVYVNEKAAFDLIIRATGLDDEKLKSAKEQRAYMLRLLNRLLYHLRFRNTSPKTLELLIYGIEFGLGFENDTRPKQKGDIANG